MTLSIRLRSVLLLLAALNTGFSSLVGRPPGVGKEFAPQLKPLLEPQVLPLVTGPTALRSLVVGVVHHDRREVWSYGRAGPDHTAPDGETLFKVASITKPLTALLLAKMTLDKRLAYDDVAIVFGDKPVTYRQLVTNTSGLPLSSDLADNSIEGFRRFLRGYTLEREPGSRFEYSTTGFGVLGLCLGEKSVSRSFEVALEKEILRPLGMASTVFALPPEAAARFAGETIPSPRRNGPNPFNASGGLISSAHDLLRFVAANLRPDSQPALAAALRLTQQACPEVKETLPGCTAALGWFVMQPGPRKFYFWSGVASGFRTFVAFDPAGDSGLVLLTNTDLPPFDARLEMAGFPLLAILASVESGATKMVP